MSENFHQILDRAGQSSDEDIDLAEVAIAMAALDSPGISVDRYTHHIQSLIKNVADRHQELLDGGVDDNAATQLAALKHILYDQNGYAGDRETYDDLQNVNLLRVIDRRKGMPVSLALLCIHVAEKQGWDLCALRMPAHVVCRLEKDGERIIFDPFDGCKIMQAADLRKLLKDLIGDHAELSADYYIPAGKREILVRMQNNIKLRQIEVEDYEGALKTVSNMRRIDPQEYRLLLDAGMLYTRVHQIAAAVEALEDYIDRTPHKSEQQEALALLQQIRTLLN